MGFVLAWRMESTQGFHAIMNLLLMPLWLLSGAFFPIPAAANGGWVPMLMHWLMRLNPVTYAVAGLRRLLYSDMPDGLEFFRDSQLWVPSLGVSWIVITSFAILMFLWAWRMAGKSTSGDLL